YSAQSFAFLVAGQSVADAAARLVAFVDGYGADQDMREALPAAMVRRTAAMLELLRSAHDSGLQPWGQMYVEGHGDHWSGALEYVTAHQHAWAAALGSRPSAENLGR
ncbi:MAG: aminoglycoside phosphotransferase, partial [Lacisediminihabitans sp.]